MDTKLIVSASPHLRSEETTQSLMGSRPESALTHTVTHTGK